MGYPERYTGDIFRDSLPELEFKLEEAAIRGDVAEVHDLIEQGADKNAPLDKDLRTPLMIACDLGWFNLVKWLIEMEGVDMDGPISRCGFRAIDYAGKNQFRWPNEDMEIVGHENQGHSPHLVGCMFLGRHPAH